MGRLPKEKAAATKYWVPLLERVKPDGSSRLITALCSVNDQLKTPRFRPDSWADLLQLLRNEDLQYCVRLDLKDWFFHLGLSRRSRRWCRLKFQGKAYEMLEMPFGLSISPYFSYRLAKPVLKVLRTKGWTLKSVFDCFV